MSRKTVQVSWDSTQRVREVDVCQTWRGLVLGFHLVLVSVTPRSPVHLRLLLAGCAANALPALSGRLAWKQCYPVALERKETAGVCFSHNVWIFQVHAAILAFSVISTRFRGSDELCWPETWCAKQFCPVFWDNPSDFDLLLQKHQPTGLLWGCSAWWASTTRMQRQLVWPCALLTQPCFFVSLFCQCLNSWSKLVTHFMSNNQNTKNTISLRTLHGLDVSKCSSSIYREKP